MTSSFIYYMFHGISGWFQYKNGLQNFTKNVGNPDPPPPLIQERFLKTFFNPSQNEKMQKLKAKISFENKVKVKDLAQKYFIPAFGPERLLWPNMSVCDHLRHSQVSVDCFRNQFITDFTTLHTLLFLSLYFFISPIQAKKMGLLGNEIVPALSLISKFTRT